MNGNGATHTCRYTVFALKREHLSECAHIQPSFAGFFGILLTIFNAFQGCGSAFAQAAKQPLPDLPPLAPRGSDFRQAVWRLLLEIPYGQVTTYGVLAQILRNRGISAAAQAVGGAVGHNPISILIPCHRVVGADGSLTGYAGGVEKKRFLLALEGVDMTNLYMPKRGTAL